MRQKYDLIIIGAGAAGLTAAAVVAKSGLSVLVIDHVAQPARKVRISGGGKCNFTNKFVSAAHYFSANPHFCKSALADFSWQDMVKKIESVGLAWEEREDGKCFAFSGESVARFLKSEADKAGADFLFGVSDFDLVKDGDFRLMCAKGAFQSPCVLVATGGVSYPAVGATDVGYRLARRFGLKVIPPEPALVSLDFAAGVLPDLSGLAGVSVPACVKTGKTVRKGDLLLTNRGFSGPVILQTSLYWRTGEAVTVDFLPDADLENVLKQRRTAKEKKRIAAVLGEFLPARLATRFCEVLPPDAQHIPVSALSDKAVRALVQAVKLYRFVPPATGGWAKAEVTKGGVDTVELSSSTMESRKVAGLYFAGEVVDVTGEVGGYNLHWAWASAVAAGKAIINRKS